MDLNESEIYKRHRIHITQLLSGVWVVSVVKLGRGRELGGGPPVERIRGEYGSEAEAVSAAKQHVDRESLPPAASLA